MTLRHLLGLSLLLSLCVLVGCGKKNPTPATVKGTVTYKDAPVTGGQVVFYSESSVHAGTIQPDGTYRILDLPVGEMTVTVDTEGLNPNIKKEVYKGQTKMGPKGGGGVPAGGGGGKGMPMSSPPEGAQIVESSGKYVKIPSHYADKTKTKLKYTIKDGEQVIDIKLTD